MRVNLRYVNMVILFLSFALNMEEKKYHLMLRTVFMKSVNIFLVLKANNLILETKNKFLKRTICFCFHNLTAT